MILAPLEYFIVCDITWLEYLEFESLWIDWHLIQRRILQSVDSTSAFAESGNWVLARLVPFVEMLISAMKMNEM